MQSTAANARWFAVAVFTLLQLKLLFQSMNLNRLLNDPVLESPETIGWNLGFGNQQKQQQKQNQPRLKKENKGNGNHPKEGSFSACLIVMDDNAHLIEWLAYHHQTLPLRRLIVAVDPRSQTSPTEILDRWRGDRGLMDITEWSDVDFMPPTLINEHTKVREDQLDKITELYLRRQEEFYARCMARLQYEGWTWTALFDTDEYILQNANAQGPYKLATLHDPDMTIIDAIQRDPILNHPEASPCISMARLRFGTKESTNEEIQHLVPPGYDARNFQTLRWRWHGGRGYKRRNKISKAIIDVSRVDASWFIPTTEVMVHLPVKHYCNVENLWLLNLHSPLVMHHYGGTWEQWSHRRDSRGTRTKENYNKMAYEDGGVDDNIRPWLRQFVQRMGNVTAQELLRGVGQLS